MDYMTTYGPQYAGQKQQMYDFAWRKALEEGKGEGSPTSNASPASPNSMVSVDLEKADTVAFEDMSLDEDLYGYTIKSFIRESYKLSVGLGYCYRLSRLISAFGLLWLNIAVQTALMYATRHFMSAKSVWELRELYENYEKHMYGQHNVVATGGYMRGVSGYFQEDLFETMDETMKESVCMIPLSRPGFAALILFIWTLTCVGELRRSNELFRRLIFTGAQSTSRFMRVTVCSSEDQDVYLLKGLNRRAKALISIFVLVPRVIITCVLLELGSRWLLATNNFEDLMLNGVALSFIKDMKDLIFSTLVSTYDKRELELTRVALPEAEKRRRTTCRSALKATFWGVCALAYVVSYIFYFQPVLPDYKWDVYSVCRPWMRERYVRKF